MIEPSLLQLASSYIGWFRIVYLRLKAFAAVMFGAITGGMGCGKSTVLAAFSRRGWATMDSDAMVHRLLAEDASVIKAISVRYGSGILTSQGGVDRKQLGKTVFADSKELDWLEGILHPRVRDSWQSLSTSGKAEHTIVEVPLLFEKKLEIHFEFTVCIYCSLQTQQERLSHRGLSGEQITARINRQLPLTEKANRATYVIGNDGSPTFMEAQVTRLIEQILS